MPMGSTRRLYELKEKNISVQEVVNDLWKIYHSLCIGPNRLFIHQFNFDNLSDLEKVKSKFKIHTYDMNSRFELYQTDKLIELLKSPQIFERISLSNLKTNKSIRRDYLHYWMRINSEDFNVSIVLPITENFTLIKKELKQVLFFFIEKEIIGIKKDEVNTLVDALIDSNLKENDGYTYKNNGIEFYARADYYPSGSKQIRPSSVRLNFDKDYLIKNGGKQDVLIRFYKVLNDYFDPARYKVNGIITSKFDSITFLALKKFDFINLNIPISLDLNKNLNFTNQDLELTSKLGSSFTIDKFDWKDSNPNHLDNRIYLGIKNFNDWFLQIDISKQIDEEYYFNIELLINKELGYLGIE